jgi:(p)ppGpp synthase/HD superfamily hydrolase
LHFNPEVQRIVDGVTCLDSRPQSFKRIQLSDYESIQKLLEVKDDRILYVKLADRLHNMRTIGEHRSLTEQKKIAEETLQFFVPMARGLGLKPMAEELKERCFAVLNGKPGT